MLIFMDCAMICNALLLSACFRRRPSVGRVSITFLHPLVPQFSLSSIRQARNLKSTHRNKIIGHSR